MCGNGFVYKAIFEGQVAKDAGEKSYEVKNVRRLAMFQLDLAIIQSVVKSPNDTSAIFVQKHSDY